MQNGMEKCLCIMNSATFAKVLQEKERRQTIQKYKSPQIFFTKGNYTHTHTHTHTHKLYSIIRNVIGRDSRQKLKICDRLNNEKLSPYLSTLFTHILSLSLDLSKD